MKRIGGASLVFLGIMAVLFGLLFLVGSAGKVSRLVVAVVSMLGGAVATGCGALLFKRADALLPENIQAEILELAKREDGDVSTLELRALLGDRFPYARVVLDRLQVAGICEERHRAGSTFWIFPDLQARITVRRCEYCDAELPVSEELSSCPSCGGTFTTTVKRVSIAGDAYGMDEG